MKIVLAALVVSLIPAATFASVSVAPLVGIRLDRLADMPNTAERKAGFGYRAGLLAKLHLSEQFKLRSGLIYASRTFRGEGVNQVSGTNPASGSPNVTFSVHRQSIDIPLQFEFALPTGTSYLFGGVTYSSHIATTFDSNGSDYGVRISAEPLPNDLFVNLGGGFEIYALSESSLSLEVGLETGTRTNEFGGTYRAVTADLIWNL